MIRLSRPKAKPALPTEKKEIAKKLWTLSYPTMISFGLESFYDIVDMAWVGQISPESLSGVTIFSTIYMLFTVLNEVAGDASISLISQYYGRGGQGNHPAGRRADHLLQDRPCLYLHGPLADFHPPRHGVLYR